MSRTSVCKPEISDTHISHEDHLLSALCPSRFLLIISLLDESSYVGLPQKNMTW